MSIPQRRPLWLRLFYLIPIIGWMAKDTAEKGEENLYYGAAGLVSAWGIAILTFGYPGLIIPALLLVPIIVFALIVITWG